MNNEDDIFYIARQMRGKVEEFDDTYIETWLPEHILFTLQRIGSRYEIDTDGFWWGAMYVFATKLKSSGETIVVVATKPMGQGHHELKVVDKQGEIRIVSSCECV